ncbi:MAG TPA: hypothetical protein VGP07_13000 [Polyangia bacterium]|jgi:lysophospholipase L1-like esterase
MTPGKRLATNVLGTVLLAASSTMGAAPGCAGAGDVAGAGGSNGVGTGGLVGSGGATNSGGTSGSGGGPAASGGASGTGGEGGANGTKGSGGATASGGTPGTGGAAASGGTPGTGGATPSGGALGTGGTAGGGIAGKAGAGGTKGMGSGGASGAAGRGGLAGTSGVGGAHGAGGGTSGTLPKITIWIAGDSTVMTYPEPNTDGDNMVSIYGWGRELGQFFSSQVTISNQAIGGRSVAFFMWSVVTDSTGAYQCVDSQGTPQFQTSNGNKVDTSQWARIKSGIKAGDFLLIQFGTNDETHDCPRFVSLADFETDFGFMADTVRAKGATPIFVTPQGHRSFSGTTVTNTLLPYANAMKDEAAKETVEVEDLNLESQAYYMSVGTNYLAMNIFDGGTTHFREAGAVEMATLIVAELRKNNGPLAAYLK